MLNCAKKVFSLFNTEFFLYFCEVETNALNMWGAECLLFNIKARS